MLLPEEGVHKASSSKISFSLVNTVRAALHIWQQPFLHRMVSTEDLLSSWEALCILIWGLLFFWVLLNISSERLKVNIPLGTGVAMEQVHWHWISIATIKPCNLFPEENNPLLQGRWVLITALGPMACNLLYHSMFFLSTWLKPCSPLGLNNPVLVSIYSFIFHPVDVQRDKN